MTDDALRAKIDTLAALDAWVSTGQAPERVIATKVKPGMSRPLCAYPMKAVYKGSGDPNDAGSFMCR
jgi:feruloyl esterase